MPRIIQPGNVISPMVSGEDQMRLAPGVLIAMITEQLIIPAAVASLALPKLLPVGAVATAAYIRLLTAVTATTAVGVGFGRLSATASPSKYARTTVLTANAAAGALLLPNLLADAAIQEQLGIFAVDAAGLAAGTINSGTVLVRIAYQLPEALVLS
jgi:hypothetical protein